MDHVARWPELWRQHSTAGAAWGTALNVGDPTLWPRWLLMFGLALGTTAVWLAVDAFWLAGKTGRRSLPPMGIAFRPQTLHAVHALGRRGRNVVCLRHLAGRFAGDDVRLAAAAVDHPHGHGDRLALGCC